MSIEDHVKTHISICEFQKLTPFNWDSEAECVRVTESGWKAKKYVVFSIHVSLLVGMIYETMINTDSQNNLNGYATIFRIFFILAIVGSTLYYDLIWSDSSGFSSLLNGVLQNLRGLGTAGQVLKKILTALKIGQFGTESSILALILIFPGTPPFPSSLLTFHGSIQSSAMRVVLMIIQTWDIFCGVSHGFLIMCCLILCNGAVYMGLQQMKMSRMNQSTEKKYRELQILVSYINSQFQNSIQLAITIFIIGVDITGIATIIKFNQSMPLKYSCMLAIWSTQAILVSLEAQRPKEC
ncbi:unnamed protein product [Orchesella dallaii]|uniref:Gustatory receptor n=1 Tax=Orchesella dallaii TaxID=48710 RepID=A0ABP1RN10_9HEXA